MEKKSSGVLNMHKKLVAVLAILCVMLVVGFAYYIKSNMKTVENIPQEIEATEEAKTETPIKNDAEPAPAVIETKNIDSQNQILFKNVNIFDGTSEKLHQNMNVLVSDNLIAKISNTKISHNKNAKIIDAKGKTLMPGLIDGHTHFTFAIEGGLVAAENSHWSYLGAMATYAAKEHLYNGFTTAREAGGGAIGSGFKKAIDEGFVEGPRIYPSGAFVSQTSGHGDFLTYGQLYQEENNLVRLGYTIVADGEDEVTKAVRKALSMGASQVKLMISGGISSEKDPMHSSQYNAKEIRAAVEAAKAWDTYIAAHIYNDKDIVRALENGVLSIEHGQFITKKTAELLKAKGAFLVPNLAALSQDIFKHPVYGNKEGVQYPKVKQFMEGAKNFKNILNTVDMKIVFNSDMVFTVGEDLRRGLDYEKYMVSQYLGNFRALKAMTSTAGELMALSGKQNPYPHKLGVIEVGAYADILVVDGNPLEDMSAIGANPKFLDAPARKMDIPTIRIIMKNGEIYKNTLQN